MTLHPFRTLRVGLVMSTLPGLKPSILAGTAEATAARVTALTGTLLPPLECPHDEHSIATALARLLEQHADILLVAGASAVVDRRDVGPAGIVRAGGEILHFGMPVDPGNLICLGRIGDRPALVLPGCARSPKLNGIDWVLARLFAGLPLGGRELARMGVGGLLKDVPARPLPRARATAQAGPTPPGKSVAAIILAAGRSSRMAPHNKLLVPDRPRPRHDRPRRRQRALIRRPPRHRRHRPPRGRGPRRHRRPPGPLRPRAGLRRRPLRQPTRRHPGRAPRTPPPP